MTNKIWILAIYTLSKMVFEVPYISYAAMYIVSVHFISCNSRTSSHWRVNLEQGKVVTADSHLNMFDDGDHNKNIADNKREHDLAFSIITSCKPQSDGEWSVNAGMRVSSTNSDGTICSTKCDKKNCCSNKQGYLHLFKLKSAILYPNRFITFIQRWQCI